MSKITNSTTDEEAQKLLTEIQATNQKADNFLKEFDEKLLELDLKYAKIEAEYDIEELKLVKKILEEKRGEE